MPHEVVDKVVDDEQSPSKGDENELEKADDEKREQEEELSPSENDVGEGAEVNEA